MAAKHSICQIDAFTSEAFKGNPAGVMFGNELDSTEMQAIAKEMNLSETAFLSKSDIADYRLQWFTPAVEVELCGHATIASLHFLKENDLLKKDVPVKFDTLSGVLNCKYDGELYYMQIPVPELKVYNGGRDEILEALGITNADADDNVDWIFLPSGYLYINIRKLDVIGRLKPDFKKILQISIPGYGVPQLVVYSLETKDKDSFVHSRFFAPGYGIDEDPVTGSANGPMMMVLEKLGYVSFNNDITVKTFEQGDFLDRAGRVTVQYNKITGELYIAGNAVTVIKGEIIL